MVIAPKPASLATATLALPGASKPAATSALALPGTSETTATSALALAGASETTTSTLALARASETTTSALVLAGAYNLAFRGRLRLGWFHVGGCLWCSLRLLGRRGALVLIGFFSHGCPYIFNPASRAASARALTFP